MSTPELRGLASTVLDPETSAARRATTAGNLAALVLSAPVSVITVEVRNDFGCPRVYPACNTSRVFAALIGQKTFSAQHITAIRTLGYEILVGNPAVQLPAGF